MSRKPFLVLAAIAWAAGSGSVEARVEVATDSLQLQFGAQGHLLAAVACHPGCSAAKARRVALSDPEGLVSFEVGEERGWSVQQTETADAILLEFSGPGGYSASWSVPREGYGIGLELEGANRVALQSGEGLQPRPAAGFGNWLEQVRYVAIHTHGARQFGLDDLQPATVKAEWGGFRNRFWALLVSADRPGPFDFRTAEGNARPGLVRPHKGATERLLLYLGPVEPRALAAVDPLLQKLMYAGLWFWLRWICFGLFYLLIWFHQWVPVWGLAIMLLSLGVHVLMAPLSRAADRLQQQVHATEARLAPALAEIKKNYRGEEQAARIIALYKTERVHPLYSLKSLFGVALVIPVFIGAFDMLAENIHLLNASFLWIEDLSRPDGFSGLPFELPFFGSAFNLLPVVMSALSILASGLHRPLAQHPDLRRRQLRNMMLLAAAFFVLFYTFPAGMVLYWTTNNLISVGKSLWTRYLPTPSSSGHQANP